MNSDIKLKMEWCCLGNRIVHLFKCLLVLPAALGDLVAQFTISISVVVILLAFWGAEGLKSTIGSILESATTLPDLFKTRD